MTFPGWLAATTWRLGAVWLLLLAAVSARAGAQTNAPVPLAAGTAVVLGIEGVAEGVEYLGRGGTRWHRAYVGQILDPGDRFRTGPRSRALLRFSSRENFRLNERGLLEVPAVRSGRGALELLRGALYFFHRDKPDDLEMRTRLVQAVIRGTEFVVRVEDDGTTVFHLVEGELWLTNQMGGLRLQTGQSARIDPGGAPGRTAVLEVGTALQWCLYYPNIVDVDELSLPAAALQTLVDSVAAFRRGDLLAALSHYPADRIPATRAERLYLAALLLSVGQLEPAQELVRMAEADPIGAAPDPGLAEIGAAIQTMMATVVQRHRPAVLEPAFRTAGAWLAESYARQSAGALEAARVAAREAVARAPGFSFAWVRLAELEFGFGRRKAAREAIDRSLRLAPANAQAIALRGLLLAAEGRLAEAEAELDRAITLDPGLGHGWLGRGLVRLARGAREAALADLQTAATVEPQRASFRSCLGKAFAVSGETERAIHELGLAKELDPLDPTAWYYAALLLHQQNHVNAGIRELERSRELNDNRQVYRSRLLLDQDQAVRSVHLASFYRDVGMTEPGLRAAARAVSLDYANFSAHLFLADAYDRLRDPQQVNLRYEAAWLSEYLVANLLAPAEVGIFSPNLSQQEYSRLFERRRWGVTAATDYSSNGDWTQAGAHFGNFGRFSYSIEGSHRSREGTRPNSELETTTLWARTRWQLTPAESVWFEATGQDMKSGDVRTLYTAEESSRTLRVHERQEPLLLAGYHREWAPGQHTLFLAGRLTDRLTVTNGQHEVMHVDPFFPAVGVYPHALSYRSEFDIYTGELQQIAERGAHRVTAGGRLQAGTFTTHDILDGGAFEQRFEEEMAAGSAYVYWSWAVVPPLTLVGGLSFDHLQYPANHRFSPSSSGERSMTQWNPKGGVVWTPTLDTTLRAGYAEAVGGVSFEQSFRLEPSQVAGFNQAYRSLIPESLAGANAAPRFQLAGVSFEQRLPWDLQVGIAGEWLRSEVRRTLGILELEMDPLGALGLAPSGTAQTLAFEERSLVLTAHQLLGDEWAVGARYQAGKTEYQSRYPGLAGTFPELRRSAQTALLHRVDLFGVFNHPSGWNLRGEAVWSAQSSRGHPLSPGDEEFWQFNGFVGYRLPGRRVEVRCGVLNLTGRDYRLNPISLTSEPPRERTFVAQLRLSF